MPYSKFIFIILASCTPDGGDMTDGTGQSTDDVGGTLGASETGAPTSSAMSGEPEPQELYSPCDAASDCDPHLADGCAEGRLDGDGFCAMLCGSSGFCPPDESGLGTPTCVARIFDVPAACALLCADDAICPSDLQCVSFKGLQVCM